NRRDAAVAEDPRHIRAVSVERESPHTAHAPLDTGLAEVSRILAKRFVAGVRILAIGVHASANRGVRNPFAVGAETVAGAELERDEVPHDRLTERKDFALKHEGALAGLLPPGCGRFDHE